MWIGLVSGLKYSRSQWTNIASQSMNLVYKHVYSSRSHILVDLKFVHIVYCVFWILVFCFVCTNSMICSGKEVMRFKIAATRIRRLVELFSWKSADFIVAFVVEILNLFKAENVKHFLWIDSTKMQLLYNFKIKN